MEKGQGVMIAVVLDVERLVHSKHV